MKPMAHSAIIILGFVFCMYSNLLILVKKINWTHSKLASDSKIISKKVFKKIYKHYNKQWLSEILWTVNVKNFEFN